jgi:hypothetical protein
MRDPSSDARDWPRTASSSAGIPPDGSILKKCPMHLARAIVLLVAAPALARSAARTDDAYVLGDEQCGAFPPGAETCLGSP